MRKVTKLWTKKDGTKIRICDMTDKHLVNSIKMVERCANRRKFEIPYPCFQGEMAQMYAEQEYEAMLNQDIGDFYPIYDDLLLEMERRKLKV